MNDNIVIIRTAPKKTRITQPPKPAWWKDLNDNQRRAYIAALDGLDKAATRACVNPQRASDVV